jgi:Mce-associated membrane protein
VAVPPAPRSTVGDDSTDSATTSSSRTPSARSLLALLVAFVLVVVGCLVSLGVLLVLDLSDSDDDGGASAEPQAEREVLMAQTTQFVLRVNTYGPEMLDDQNRMPEYVAQVSELLSAKFQAGFEQSVAIPEQQVAQAGYGRSAEVFAVGVANMDDDSATVLVGFVRTDSYPKPGQPRKRLEQPGNPERWAVTLVRTEGEWLVDNYAVITETPEAEGDPSQQPTASPSDEPTEGGDQQ